MKDSASISVVIPAYNSADFLNAAIDSVRAQTRPVQEIIIVDDGSSDDTPLVLSRLERELTVIRQENAGPAAARNRGVLAATGDLIAFLDADDLWTKTKIAKQLAALEKHPELALIAGDMAETDKDAVTETPSVLAKHGLRDDFIALGGREIPQAIARLVRKNFIPTGTVLVRSEIIKALDGFNPRFRYGEDLELWARIAARYPIACLPDVLLLRRQHGGNVTGNAEPLFTDLVEVMRSLRDCCANELQAAGTDPDAMVANALNDLGYWYFNLDRYQEARRAFSASLRETLTPRAFIYHSITAFPDRLIRRFRKTKQQISGLNH